MKRCDQKLIKIIKKAKKQRKHRNKEAKNVKHKGSRFIGKRFFLVCVIIYVVFFCGCMDVASQQETIPKLSQMYAFFNLHCGCSTNVVPNSLRLFGSSFLLSFLPFSPSSLTREIILVDVYLIFTQLSFYLPSHYTPQIQAEEITLH